MQGFLAQKDSEVTGTRKYTALNLSDTVAKHHQFTPLLRIIIATPSAASNKFKALLGRLSGYRL